MSIRSRQATRDEDEAPAIWGGGDLLDPVPEEKDDPTTVVDPKHTKRLARRYFTWRSRLTENERTIP